MLPNLVSVGEILNMSISACPPRSWAIAVSIV